MVPLAHGAHVGGAEPQLLVFGIVIVGLAFLFRPSQTGNARTSVITLVIGVLLILGSVAIPRL
jgi:hypothetical protein